eukprot:COSAG04_NODE_474_length_13783_cov_18.185691_11_plen_97_part_00
MSLREPNRSQQSAPTLVDAHARAPHSVTMAHRFEVRYNKYAPSPPGSICCATPCTGPAPVAPAGVSMPLAALGAAAAAARDAATRHLARPPRGGAT